MCAVARHKKFISSVCIVRKSSSCACDNRADCKDHVACGSCAARVVSMSCNPKLSYLVYLIHSAHPAQFVALERGFVSCTAPCIGPFVIVLHVSRRSRSYRAQCNEHSPCHPQISPLLPKSGDSLVFLSLARVTRSAQVAHCSCHVAHCSCLVRFDQFTQLLWF